MCEYFERKGSHIGKCGWGWGSIGKQGWGGPARPHDVYGFDRHTDELQMKARGALPLIFMHMFFPAQKQTHIQIKTRRGYGNAQTQIKQSKKHRKFNRS